MRVYLASQSPRRLSLLQGAGLEVDLIEAPVHEERLQGEDPLEMVKRLACQKARAALPYATLEQPVIAGDSTVFIGDACFGKPTSRQDAIDMLTYMSGKTHYVATGFCVVYKQQEFVDAVVTSVRFRELSTGNIEEYVDTEKPFDKAGSYAIQSSAIAFVEDVQGSLTNVIGLPLTQALQAIYQVTA